MHGSIAVAILSLMSVSWSSCIVLEQGHTVIDVCNLALIFCSTAVAYVIEVYKLDLGYGSITVAIPSLIAANFTSCIFP